MALKVAQETLAYCSQCKMDLGAVIVAMKGDQIVRVQCKTCKKERAYKAPKGVSDPGEIPEKKPSPTARGARTDTGERVDRSVGAEWKKTMAAHAQAPAVPYSAKAKFAVGDKIRHPTFGDGLVTKQIYPNKVEILFEMDVKVLICGGHS